MGKKRYARRHETGKSNLSRALKMVDVAEIAVKPPVLKFVDPNEQANRTWKRPTTLYEPPIITTSKLGGVLVRPESRCTADRVQHVLSSFLSTHETNTFLQPQWSNDQPCLGISEWEPGEAPRSKPVFTMTDDIFIGGGA